MHHQPVNTIESLIKRKPVTITGDDSLRTAVEIMANENIDVVPVISSSGNKVTGILSYKDILSVYKLQASEHQQMRTISVRRKTLKLLVRGKKRLAFLKEKNK
jgi:CBS domain-containing protein